MVPVAMAASAGSVAAQVARDPLGYRGSEVMVFGWDVGPVAAVRGARAAAVEVGASALVAAVVVAAVLGTPAGVVTLTAVRMNRRLVADLVDGDLVCQEASVGASGHDLRGLARGHALAADPEAADREVAVLAVVGRVAADLVG